MPKRSLGLCLFLVSQAAVAHPAPAPKPAPAARVAKPVAGAPPAPATLAPPATLPAVVTHTMANATLTVADPSATAPGHLLNGTFVMAQPLQVSAGGPFAPLTSPASLLTWSGPVSSEKTRHLLDWHPTHNTLIADLDAGYYFGS